MMRASIIMSSSALTRNLVAADHLLSSGTLIQCVRWKRKPIWLPTAKSKVFRVPKRPVLPKDDHLELQRLHNNYRTYMRSLTKHIIKAERAKMEDFDVEHMEKKESEDFLRCSLLNDEWNRQVAKERDARLAEEREARKQKIAQVLMERKEKDTKIQEEIEARVRKAKEDSATFITAENIDRAIEEALETIVNHNAALDSNGNFYEGKYSQDTEFNETPDNRIEAAQ